METLDLSQPQFRLDPYKDLRRVQEAGPLCLVQPYGFIGVTRYSDVVSVLSDPKTFASSGMEHVFPPIPGAEFFSRRMVLINSDPPAHSRIRRLVQRAFTIQKMADSSPKIAELTRTLLDRVAQRPSFDLIADLAMPLPVAVIAELLGVDPAHQRDFKRWSDDMTSVRSVQNSTDSAWRQHREAEIVRSCDEFIAYFSAAIALRQRDSSGPDLLSAMVRASADEDILKPTEVLGLARLMLIAGNETTTNLLGNAMTAMLSDRPQWQALVDDPSLAAAATEEALRFDGPVIHLLRRVTEATELAGTELPAGTILAPLLAAANRDPRQFPNPDAFVIRRERVGNVGFGMGVHLCVGAPLARLEMQTALTQLAQRFADLHIGPLASSDMLDSLNLRGHRRLQVVRGPALPAGRQRHHPTRLEPEVRR